ncbi:hypothetical protein SAY87_022156 [Trapa incisa]|uniref:Uncharacterized protein n=1 Tax=Trapa incisa TaxID=236973 RepID=A0AAN7JSV3_9MYRT|nr:hypothetical protein SAY87_022156 [Trapa incisa]
MSFVTCTLISHTRLDGHTHDTQSGSYSDSKIFLYVLILVCIKYRAPRRPPWHPRPYLRVSPPEHPSHPLMTGALSCAGALILPALSRRRSPASTPLVELPAHRPGPSLIYCRL